MCRELILQPFKKSFMFFFVCFFQLVELVKNKTIHFFFVFSFLSGVKKLQGWRRHKKSYFWREAISPNLPPGSAEKDGLKKEFRDFISVPFLDGTTMILPPSCDKANKEEEEDYFRSASTVAPPEKRRNVISPKSDAEVVAIREINSANLTPVKWNWKSGWKESSGSSAESQRKPLVR